MARVNKNEEATKDRLWEIIKEEVDDQLSNESCLDNHCCSSVGEDVANTVIDKVETLVEDLTNMGDKPDVLEFLIRLKSRYCGVLEAPEQRELDRLIIELGS